MSGDAIDTVQIFGLTVALVWPSARGLIRIRSQVGQAFPEAPSPYRRDNEQEHRNRKTLLWVLTCAAIACGLILCLPKIPGVKDRAPYIIGLVVYGLHALWHLLYLKGIVKVRTLWPGYMKRVTRFDIVKEALVLRAHERGERIPSDEEIEPFAQMSEEEFSAWLVADSSQK